MKRLRMMNRIGVALAVLLLAGVLHADSRDDLSHAKRDLDSLKSHTDDAKYKADQYLDESRKLREMDKDQLAALIDQLCRQDVKRDDDEADRLDKELRDKAIDRVRREYDHTVDDAGRVIDQIEHVMNDAKSLRDRVHDLKGKDDIKDDASRLSEDVDKAIEAIDRLMEKVQSDKRTLDRVKDGVMNGSNNPTIRARMDYGKEKHKEMQDRFRCDEREVVLSSGRPDCIKFETDRCVVIEFKPSTYSTSDAQRQATGYIDDVRRKFKDDDRAKKCRRDDSGPIFEAVGETYTACRAP
jgi:gas vesicle protein